MGTVVQVAEERLKGRRPCVAVASRFLHEKPSGYAMGSSCAFWVPSALF
jgi:hypothetical protein